MHHEGKQMRLQLYLLSLCMTTDKLLGVKSNSDNLTFSYHEKIVEKENLQDTCNFASKISANCNE